MGPAGVGRLGIAGEVVAEVVLVADDDGQDAQGVLVALEDPGPEEAGGCELGGTRCPTAGSPSG